MILPLIAGVVVRAAAGYAIKKIGQRIATKALKKAMEKAIKNGDDLLKKEAKRRKDCKTCKKLDELADPCKLLRSGNPASGGKYRGGSYDGTKKPGIESNHMPANSAYPPGSMSEGKMPAIQMDPADHQKTASWGSSNAAKAYRDAQTKAMKKGGAVAALAMDAADILAKQEAGVIKGDYTEAIAEAAAYAACIDQYPDKYPIPGRKKRK